MKKSELVLAVESILFASDLPLSIEDLYRIIDEVDVELFEVQTCINHLNNEYKLQKRAFHLLEQGGGWQFVTIPESATWIKKLFVKKKNQRLSQRALETLAIVAYNQPITKGLIEDIRGVNSDGIVRSLLGKDLITVVGRQKSAGNPMLYSTTKQFLRHFGINSTSNLPTLKEINELLETDKRLEKEIKQLDPVKFGIQLEKIKANSINSPKTSLTNEN